jgi:hypothetical protein
MPDRSKGMGQMKCSLWSSRLGVGYWANNPTPEKFTVMKPHKVIALVKKKKKNLHTPTFGQKVL